MVIRVDRIGDDLKALVRESTKTKREQNIFAQRCGIQPQRLRLWLIGEVEFQQTNLEKIGQQLIKQKEL